MMERNSRIEAVTSELKKNDPDPDLIDRLLDELYRLDGLSPPKLDAGQLHAAARTIQARSAWRGRNSAADRALKHRLASKAVRWAVAACFSILLFVSANYVSTLLTGSCLPSKAGIKICCGTKYCFCPPEGEAAPLP